MKMTFPQGIPSFTSVKVAIIKLNNDNFLPTGDGMTNNSGAWTFTRGQLSNLQSELPVNAQPFDTYLRHVSADRNFTMKKEWHLKQTSAGSAFRQMTYTLPLSGKLRFGPGNTLPDQGYYVVMRVFNPNVGETSYVGTLGQNAASTATAVTYNIQTRFTYTDQ